MRLWFEHGHDEDAKKFETLKHANVVTKMPLINTHIFAIVTVTVATENEVLVMTTLKR